MLLTMQSFLAVWLCLTGLFGRIVSGQCSISWPYLVSNAVCAVDGSGDTDVEFQVHPTFGGCGGGNPQASFTASMTYTNTLGAVTAIAAPLTITTTLGVNAVLTFDFPVPFSLIQDGSQVTQALIAQAPQIVIFAGIVYTQTQSQSIFYQATTSTLTITTETEATAFVTTTNTDTQTLPGPTVTVTTVTGFNTVTAPRPTITKTITFTPRPKTVRKFSVNIITTTLSCIRPYQKNGRRGGSPHAEFIAARQAGITYENANCGTITPTTVITSTALVTNTVTSTDTVTSTVPTDITISVTAPPVTAYQSVIGTTTLTPSPRVKTRYTIASRVTVTSTQVVTITKVVVPYKPLPPCTPPTRKPINAGGRPTVYRSG